MLSLLNGLGDIGDQPQGYPQKHQCCTKPLVWQLQLHGQDGCVWAGPGAVPLLTLMSSPPLLGDGKITFQPPLQQHMAITSSSSSNTWTFLICNFQLTTIDRHPCPGLPILTLNVSSDKSTCMPLPSHCPAAAPSHTVAIQHTCVR